MPAVAPQRADAAYFKEGTGQGSPLLMSWRPALREQRESVRTSWQAAAARTIDAWHNSGFIAGIIEASEAAVVGTGLQLASRPDVVALGWTEDQANDWSERVENAWAAWCADPLECDAGGRMTFWQMQALVYRCYLLYGEYLSLAPRLRRRSPTMSKVLLLPPSRLVNSGNGYDIVDGVKVDQYGAPIGYRITVVDEKSGFRAERDYAAFDRDGRRLVIHGFGPEVMGTRGLSPFANVLKVVRQVDQFADATLTTALIQTIFAATIRNSVNGVQAFAGLMTEDENLKTMDPIAFANFKNEWYKSQKIDLGNHGRIAHLAPGDELDFKEAKHPSAQYDAFMSWLLREIARCAGVTYETATGDYRNATYSSVRVALAENWMVVTNRRANIPARFSQAAYENWLEEEIGTGRIPFPGGLDAFFANRAAASRASWSGPAQPQADDLKTAQAHQTNLQIGATTLEGIATSYGRDWKSDMDQRAREKAYALSLGLPDPYPPPELKEGQKRDEAGDDENKQDDPTFDPSR